MIGVVARQFYINSNTNACLSVAFQENAKNYYFVNSTKPALHGVTFCICIYIYTYNFTYLDIYIYIYTGTQTVSYLGTSLNLTLQDERGRGMTVYNSSQTPLIDRHPTYIVGKPHVTRGTCEQAFESRQSMYKLRTSGGEYGPAFWHISRRSLPRLGSGRCHGHHVQATYSPAAPMRACPRSGKA